MPTVTLDRSQAAWDAGLDAALRKLGRIAAQERAVRVRLDMPTTRPDESRFARRRDHDRRTARSLKTIGGVQ